LLKEMGAAVRKGEAERLALVQRLALPQAACYAVSIGTGQGKDAAALSPEERASWRKQALAWLQADFTALS